MMKALVYRRYGPPEVLRMEEVARPRVKPKSVLIRVHAVEATKGDCELRGFKFAVKWFSFPLRLAVGVFRPRNGVLGGYFAGEVEAVGSEVRKFQVGQRVFGCSKLSLGAYAEYLAVPEHYTLVPMPENISYAEAAAVPLGGLNALHFLRKAEVKPGEKVLVNGAGGSIGSFAVQIAKAMGAEVTAVDIGFKEAMLRSIGADHFIDYQVQDIFQLNERYDVLFDMVASTSHDDGLALLNSGGRYISGNPTFKKLTSAGKVAKSSDKKMIVAFAGETVEELEALKVMLEEGKIKPAIDSVMPMKQGSVAHQRVESETRVGIVVLTWDSDGQTI